MVLNSFFWAERGTGSVLQGPAQMDELWRPVSLLMGLQIKPASNGPASQSASWIHFNLYEHLIATTVVSSVVEIGYIKFMKAYKKKSERYGVDTYLVVT